MKLTRGRITVTGVALGVALIAGPAFLVGNALLFPVFTKIRDSRERTIAADKFRRLGAALSTYLAQNDGEMPHEGRISGTSWAALRDPENAGAWYNVLPGVIGATSATVLASAPESFYSDESVFYLPSATYAAAKLSRPYFPIALNTSPLPRVPLARPPWKASDFPQPGRSIILFESGVFGERKPAATMAKYTGEPDSTLRTFVTRSGDTGFALFLDGHVEALTVTSLPPR